MSNITINQKLLDKFTVQDDLLAKIAEQIHTTNKLIQAKGMSFVQIPDVDISFEVGAPQVFPISKESIVVDKGYFTFKGDRYEILYQAIPYIEITMVKSTTFKTINTIDVPISEAYLIVDFSANTESIHGAGVSIGFNTSIGSILSDLTRGQYGPAPLGSTGSIQFDTLSTHPVLVKGGEKIFIKAENTDGANDVDIGYTFHILVMRKVALL